MTTLKPSSETASLAIRKSSHVPGPKSQGKKKNHKAPPSGHGHEPPRGPRHVAPAPVSGPWGKPHALTTSAAPPPPGFATSARTPPPSTSPTVGFSDAHVRLLRHRALFAFRFLVGKAVELQVVASDERYAGILDCVDPDAFSIVLKSAKRVRTGTSAKPFVDGRTVIFRRDQVAYLVADGAIDYTDAVGATASQAAAGSSGFRTDTEISGDKGKHLVGRELETASSWLDPALDTGALEDVAPSGRRPSKSQEKAGWDQFEANEKLFGVVSSYDENIYTTKLDKTKLTTEQSRAAEKLALEIEQEATGGNFHLQEERGQTGHRGTEVDEEARYSSVARRTSARAASVYRNVYMPPALRKNTARQASGGDPCLASSRCLAPASARSVVTPAPTGTEAPAAPPRPLSFSEAVIGRSTATASPAVAPKAAPSVAEEAKRTVASPPKAAASEPVDGTTATTSAAPPSREASPMQTDAVCVHDESATEERTALCVAKESPARSSSSSSSLPSTTSPSQGTKALGTDTRPAPGAQKKKGLNPHAKEFKLSASAAEFTPRFAAVLPVGKDDVFSSPYRSDSSPTHTSVPHVGRGYAPLMLDEWMMYESGLGGDDDGTTGGGLLPPPYLPTGYAMPMGPGGVPMLYPYMMPQQHLRVLSAQRGSYSGTSYPPQGAYDPRGYYAAPHSGTFGVPYTSSLPGSGGGPQPPLPPTPSSDDDATPDVSAGRGCAPVAGTRPPGDLSGANEPSLALYGNVE